MSNYFDHLFNMVKNSYKIIANNFYAIQWMRWSGVDPLWKMKTEGRRREKVCVRIWIGSTVVSVIT